MPPAQEPGPGPVAELSPEPTPEARLQRLTAAVQVAATPAELELARSALRQLALEAEAAGDRTLRGRSLLRLAWVAHELGDEPAARAAQAELGPPSPELDGWAVVELSSLLESCIAAEAFERAASTAAWALRDFAVTPTRRALLLSFQQDLARRLGQHATADAALDELERQLALLRADPAVPTSARAMFETRLHLGRTAGWLSLGVLDRAAVELERALASVPATGNLGEEVATTMAYSDLFLLQDRSQLALQVCDRFLESAGERLSADQRRTVLLQQAVAYSELARADAQHHAAARALLREFLAQEHAREDLTTRAELELADRLLCSEGGDTGVEPAALARAEALLRSAEANLPARGVELREAALAAALRARWVLASTPAEGDLDRALHDANSAFEHLLEEWRRIPRRRGGVGFLQLSYRRMLISMLIELHLARDSSPAGPTRALEVVLAAQAEGALTADLGGQPVSLARLRSHWLGAEHGCLVLLPGRHMSHLFAFDRERLLHRRLPPRSQLTPALDAFLRVLYATPARRAGDEGALFAELERNAAELAGTLFDEQTRDLIGKWKRLTVVGAEHFKGLPLECLPLAPGGELLGLTHAVNAVPSLPLAAHLHELAGLDDRADDAGSGIDLLLAATLTPPRPGPGMQVVRPAELERGLAALLVPFEEQRTRLLLGDAASWESLISLRSRAGRPAEVLHILAHGAYDAERERGAYLALAASEARPDGRVFASDIEARGSAGRLVLLSACASARGPERLGSDNLSHLGGAFLRAGARCVTLSRADLSLGQTLRLDRALHTALADGTPIAEALRLARRAALDHGPFSPYLVGRVQAYGLGSARVLGTQ